MLADEARNCRSLERIIPAFCAMVVALVLAAASRFADPGAAAGSFALLGLAALATDALARRRPRWAPYLLVGGSVVLLFGIYSGVSLVAQWLLPEDREWFLLRFDRAVLGYTWERWWSGLQAPWLTDLLQAVYTSFYLLPLVLALALARRRDWQGVFGALDRVMLAFLLSYCGYLLVPTRSPYPFVAYAAELPTWGLQPFLHSEVVEISWTKRDCFPSGHTMITLLIAWLTWVRARPLSWLVLPWALLTMVATVYLRYHYLVDVLAGVAAFFLYAAASRWIFGSFAPASGRTGPGAAGA